MSADETARLAPKPEAVRPWRALALALVFALLALGTNARPDRVLLPEDPRIYAPIESELSAAEIAEAKAAAVPSRRDAILQFLPFDASVARQWGEGRPPLWETRYLCGAPMLAQATSRALYPSAGLFALVGPGRGALWSWLLHLVLGGFFAYLLARRLAASEAGGLLANASLVLSGYAWAHVGHPMIFMAAVWLLPALVAADGLVREDTSAARARIARCASLAFCVALSWLAGFSQASILLCYAVTAYVACHALRRLMQKQSLAPVAFAAFGVAIGLALAAPQILPTIEMAEHSARQPIDRAAQLGLALRWPQLLDFIAPGQVAAPHDILVEGSPRATWLALFTMPRDAWPTLSRGDFNYTETALGFGIWPFFFALAAILGLLRSATSERLGRATLAGIALFALAAALAVPGIFDVATALPGFAVGDVRRLIMLPGILLPVLAGCGFSRLRIPVALGALIVGFILTALGLALFAARHESLAETMISWLSWKSGFPADTIANAFGDGELEQNQTLLARGALLGGVALMLGGALGRHPRLAPIAILAACVLELAPIAWTTTNALPTEAVDRARVSPLTQAVVDDDAKAAPRVLRVEEGAGSISQVTLWPPNLPSLAACADVLGYAPIPPRRFEAFVDCVEPGAPSGGAGIPRLRQSKSLAHPLLELAAADVLLTNFDELPPAARDRWTRVAERRGVTSWKRAQPAARVRLYGGATFLESGDAGDELDSVRSLLQSEGFDAMKQLLVEGAAPASVNAGVLTPDDTLRVQSWRSASITLTYETARDSWAFVAEGWMPGWTAEIDAGDGEILRVATRPAQLAFQAFPLPAGRGTIRLRYAPKSFRHGLWAALAAVLALLTLSIWALSRGRRA